LRIPCLETRLARRVRSLRLLFLLSTGTRLPAAEPFKRLQALASDLADDAHSKHRQARLDPTSSPPPPRVSPSNPTATTSAKLPSPPPPEAPSPSSPPHRSSLLRPRHALLFTLLAPLLAIIVLRFRLPTGPLAPLAHGMSSTASSATVARSVPLLPRADAGELPDMGEPLVLRPAAGVEHTGTVIWSQCVFSPPLFSSETERLARMKARADPGFARSQRTWRHGTGLAQLCAGAHARSGARGRQVGAHELVRLVLSLLGRADELEMGHERLRRGALTLSILLQQAQALRRSEQRRDVVLVRLSLSLSL